MKFSLSSFKSLIFKKFKILDACSSFKLAPLVTAPLESFLSFLSKSSTPFKPKPGLSSLSIALITFNCFSSGIFKSLIKPWIIFLLLTLILNCSLFRPQSNKVLETKLHNSTFAWDGSTFPIMSKSACVNSLNLALPGFSFLKTFWIA